MKGKRKLLNGVSTVIELAFAEPEPPVNKSRIIGTMLKYGYFRHHFLAGLDCPIPSMPFYSSSPVSTRTNHATAWSLVEMHPGQEAKTTQLHSRATCGTIPPGRSEPSCGLKGESNVADGPSLVRGLNLFHVSQRQPFEADALAGCRLFWAGTRLGPQA